MEALDRVRRPRWRVTLAVALAGALALLAGCGGTATADGPPAPGPTVGARVSHPQQLPPAISRLQLRDSSGKRVSLKSYAGKVVVISDVLTLCQETCPMETQNLVTAARHVDRAGLGDKVEFLSITVDPHRDTPRRLAAYRKFFAGPGDLPNWDLLTGSPPDLTKLWKYFGVYVQRAAEDSPPGTDWMTHQPLTYDVTHGDQLIFLDGKTRERFLISGPADVPNPSRLPGTVRRFLNDEGRENLRHPKNLAWKPGQVEPVVGWLTGTAVKPAHK